MSARGEFSSRFGFLMAASGSAIGLGNIWGFPTNAASNGGAAFLFVYLLLVFGLAYPTLMAELIIGRHAQANAVKALQMLANGPVTRTLGTTVGLAGIVTVSLILSFYSIIGGWMLAWMLESPARLLDMNALADWATADSVSRNAVFDFLFMVLTTLVIMAGVREGIEKWGTRLMPCLILILILLILYVLTLDGAMDGLGVYLIPDFSRAMDPGLIINALGQAFFSLSLGVGTMLIYGSYISPRENLATVGWMVAAIDTSFAFMAGLLILPAMYVALGNGVQILDANGALVAGPGLIVAVLPALFDTMGDAGQFVSFAFFILMSIAALTSSISMLEVPVAYAVETFAISRRKATLLIGALIAVVSQIIVFNFAQLFDVVVTVTTEYSQPLLSLFFAVFVGWIWHRNGVLRELQKGNAGAEHTFFWKIWPFYIRYICPIAIVAVYVQLVFL